MSESAQPIQVESIHLRDLASFLPQTRIFAETPFDAIGGVDQLERVRVKAGTTLIEAGAPWEYYWLVLEGETQAERPESDGTWTIVGGAQPGEAFGEAPLLTGRATSMFRVFAAKDSVNRAFQHAGLSGRCSPVAPRYAKSFSPTPLYAFRPIRLRRCIARNLFRWAPWLPG